VAEDIEQLIDRGHLLEETPRQDFHGGMSTTKPLHRTLDGEKTEAAANLWTTITV